MTPSKIQGLDNIATYIGKHCGGDPPCHDELLNWITRRRFPATRKSGKWSAWSDLVEHWTNRTLIEGTL